MPAITRAVVAELPLEALRLCRVARGLEMFYRSKKKKNVQGARHSTRTCTRVFPESRADRTVRAERTLRRKPQWINELTRPCVETVSTISERTLTLRTRFNSLSLAPPRSPQLVPWRINFAH